MNARRVRRASSSVVRSTERRSKAPFRSIVRTLAVKRPAESEARTFRSERRFDKRRSNSRNVKRGLGALIRNNADPTRKPSAISERLEASVALRSPLSGEKSVRMVRSGERPTTSDHGFESRLDVCSRLRRSTRSGVIIKSCGFVSALPQPSRLEGAERSAPRAN